MVPVYRFYSAVIGLVLLLGMAPDANAALKTGTLTIQTKSGPHQFKIEVADTEADREHGLMDRRSLDKDAGMIFTYTSPRKITMWMENTLIPLDMLFIHQDGTIQNIRERAVPMSEEIIPSDGDVSAVLELNGGTAARLGIQPGDKVIGMGLGQ